MHVELKRLGLTRLDLGLGAFGLYAAAWAASRVAGLLLVARPDNWWAAAGAGLIIGFVCMGLVAAAGLCLAVAFRRRWMFIVPWLLSDRLYEGLHNLTTRYGGFFLGMTAGVLLAIGLLLTAAIRWNLDPEKLVQK